MTDSAEEIGLKPVPSLPSATGSKSLTPSQTRPSGAQMDAARRAAKKILGGYPDYGKAPPEYVVNFAEALSWLAPEELALVTDPRNGILARCQFLPTIADIHATLRDAKARKEQFRPAQTPYKRLAEEHGPWDAETDYERKAKVVRELLGYNPSPAAEALAPKRTLTPATKEDLANLKLKTPPAKPSPQLLAKCRKEGWPFIPSPDEAA